MNLNRMVNMILNVVTRRVVNLLVNRGFQLFVLCCFHTRPQYLSLFFT